MMIYCFVVYCIITTNDYLLSGCGEAGQYLVGPRQQKSLVFEAVDRILCSLDKTYVEELRNNTPTLKENTKKIRSKLEKLSVPEQQEWSETMVLKCKGLYRAQMTGDLPTALKTLVSVSTERRSRMFVIFSRL